MENIVYNLPLLLVVFFNDWSACRQKTHGKHVNVAMIKVQDQGCVPALSTHDDSNLIVIFFGLFF